EFVQVRAAHSAPGDLHDRLVRPRLGRVRHLLQPQVPGTVPAQCLHVVRPFVSSRSAPPPPPGSRRRGPAPVPHRPRTRGPPRRPASATSPPHRTSRGGYVAQGLLVGSSTLRAWGRLSMPSRRRKARQEVL